MKRIGCDYTISKDISFFMEAENINSSDLAKKIKISRRAIDELLNSDVIKDEVCDKLYSYLSLSNSSLIKLIRYFFL